MIYFSSDLHFCHNKEFLYGKRGFKNIQEHNEVILNNFNNILTWEDELYLLGDNFLNDNEQGFKLLKEIPVKKIYFIIGNHDTLTRIDLISSYHRFEILGYANILKYNKYHFYLSHYPTLIGNTDDNIKPLKSRIINLCGHTHTKSPFTDFDKGLIYHTEIDAHNCFPVSIDKIIEDIREKFYVKESKK